MNRYSDNEPIVQANSPSQQEAIRVFDEFVQASDIKVMIVTGQAGTGKTELIAEMVRRSRERRRPIHLMAPTGQAARRLANRCGYDANTVHATIYTHVGPRVTEANDAPQEVFAIKDDQSHSQDALFVVDEASFISNLETPVEDRTRLEMVFGTTNLLHDILQYVSTGHRQIVFVGDPHQLPPIGLDHAPALLQSTFDQLTIAAIHVQLKEMHRRDESSPITLLGEHLVRSIEIDDHDLIELPSQSFGVLSELTNWDDIEAIYSDIFRGDAVAVAWRHVTIAHLNHQIRSKNGISSEFPVPGDRLLLAAPLLDPFVPNGDEIAITHVSESVIVINEQILVDGESIEVDLHLTEIEASADNGTGSRTALSTFLVSNHCNSLSQQTLNSIRKVLWIDFVKRMAREGITRTSSEFWPRYRSDSRIHSLRATYSYARTIHKSQGGEWPIVLADFTGLSGTSASIKRLIYTATTRAKEKLYVVRWPYTKRDVDLDGFARKCAEDLKNNFGDVFEVRNIQNGRQIASALISINVFERRRRLGKYIIQRCPPASLPMVEEIVRINELALRVESEQILEPGLIERIERLVELTQEHDLDLYCWSPGDYQIAICIRRESAEAEVHFYYDSSYNLKGETSTPNSDETLKTFLRSLIGEVWS
jgi:AAA domain/UvrD-like helicase C-terminal domain